MRVVNPWTESAARCLGACSRESRSYDEASAEASLISDIDIATADANRAAVSDGIEFVIPGVAIVIAALIVLGLRPRIDEYRYRT